MSDIVEASLKKLLIIDSGSIFLDFMIVSIKGRIAFVMVGSLLFLSGCATVSDSEKRVRFINQVEQNSGEIIEFRNLLEKSIDTSFCIETRFKDKSCHFFYFIDGSIHGSFVPPESIAKEICRIIGKFQFRGIWKYAEENLYRIHVQDEGKLFAQILIRHSGESAFNFSVESSLSGIERIKDINLLREDYSYKPMIVTLSDSMLVYFP
jgi:hypothetical protein